MINLKDEYNNTSYTVSDISHQVETIESQHYMPTYKRLQIVFKQSLT